MSIIVRELRSFTFLCFNKEGEGEPSISGAPAVLKPELSEIKCQQMLNANVTEM